MARQRLLTFGLGLLLTQGVLLLTLFIELPFFGGSEPILTSTDTSTTAETATDLSEGSPPREVEKSKEKQKEKQVAVIRNTFSLPEAGKRLLWGDESIVPASLTDKDLVATTALTAATAPLTTAPLAAITSSSIALGSGIIPLTYTVKRGDTLSGIWKTIGGVASQVHGAAQAFKKAKISLSSIQAGEKLEFSLDRSGQVHSLKKPLRDGQMLVLTSTTPGSFSSEVLIPKITRTERSVSGTISQSLAQASVEQGIPYEVVDEFVDLFSGRIEFSRDVQPGDTFTVIYEERNSEHGDRLSPGPIQAASLMNSGELLVAIRHETPKGPAHYDHKGKPLGNHFLRYPVKYTRISSMFTKARFHPVLKRWRPHNGVDFAAPTGTPVRAVADGIVKEAHYHRANGNWVKLQHGSKYATAYLHLHRIAKGIKKGSKVTRGQVIGSVGSTGLSTGPHLHYSFYVNGKYVDPMKVKLPTVPEKYHPIPEKILKATLRKLRRHHKELKLAAVDSPSKAA